MGRMEMYQLAQSDLERIHQEQFMGRFFDISEGGVQFRDPVTNDLLVPGEVPPSILEHPELGSGTEYLRSLGRSASLGVQFFLGSHGSADDFRHLQSVAPHVLEESTLVAIEASWVVNDSHSEGAVSPYEIDIVPILATQSSGRHAFQTAQINWLKRHDKLILPCQIAHDDTSILAKRLAELWDISAAAKADNSLEPGVRNATRTIANSAYQSVRQWTILAQLGTWLLHMKTHSLLADDYATVPLMLGRWHARSQDRLSQLGIPSEAYYAALDPTLDTAEYMAWGDMMMESTYTARASYAFLQAKMPY